jgi:hypothetical protein
MKFDKIGRTGTGKSSNRITLGAILLNPVKIGRTVTGLSGFRKSVVQFYLIPATEYLVCNFMKFCQNCPGRNRKVWKPDIRSNTACITHLSNIQNQRTVVFLPEKSSLRFNPNWPIGLIVAKRGESFPYQKLLLIQNIFRNNNISYKT